MNNCTVCHQPFVKGDTWLDNSGVGQCWRCYSKAIDRLSEYIAAAPNVREAKRRYREGVVPLGETAAEADAFLKG